MKETVQLLVKAAALQEAYMLNNTQQRMTDFLTELTSTQLKMMYEWNICT